VRISQGQRKRLGNWAVVLEAEATGPALRELGENVRGDPPLETRAGKTFQGSERSYSMSKLQNDSV